MDEKENVTENNGRDVVTHWLAELVEQSKDQIEKNHKTIKMQVAIIILLIASMVGETIYFVHVMNSYEYVYQDGSGQNNYNNNVDGDVSNVATGEEEEER